MNKILTAIDMNNTHKSIINIVEEKVIQFNKKRITKEIKIQRDLINVNISNEDKIDLTKEQKEEIKLKIINDDITKSFKNEQYSILNSQKENYTEFRKNIDSLNDLDKYAIDIERAELQTVDKFKSYEDIILHSINNNYLFISIKKSKLNDIQTKIDKLTINEGSFNFNDLMEDSLNIMLKIRQMYKHDIDVDDFYLFDKYDLQTNIDFSLKISENLFIKVANNILTDNILNEFLPKNSKPTLINKLVKTQIITNKMLAILFSNEFITNNSTTTLNTTYTKNTNLEKVYRTRTLGELLLEITNEENIVKSKVERQQIYITYDGIRPSKEEYYKWNGLQVFDIDLKYWIQKSGGNINQLKNEIHNMLIDFHWYLWICTSSSGNGLHIYTKVTPPHHVYIKPEENEYILKYWYNVNYATKLSNIYDVLHRLHKIRDNNIDFSLYYKEYKSVVMMEENDVKHNKYVDNVVSRITAGIRLSFDTNPLINHNFLDLHVSLGLGQTLDGYEYQETIQNVLLENTKFIEIINNTLVVQSQEEYLNQKNKATEIDLSKFVSLNIDIGEIKVLPKNNINYTTRYNVCNTLASLFGKDGLSIAHKVLDSEGCNNIGEINSFYSCAISNTKEPSKIGLEILKKAGIIKSIEPELLAITENDFKTNLKQQIENTLINTELNIDYRLLSNQYLSDIKEELVNSFTGEKINILLSPPGTGKCFGKNTKIRMYDCSVKLVQNIIPGDILMGWDSKPRKVLSTCIGKEELYKIIPIKGEPWICNKSHILSLHTKNGYEPKILNIELSEYLKLSDKDKNIWRQFRAPINFIKKDIDIDPYFLGYWLGDGTTNDCEFTISNKDINQVLPRLNEYITEFDCEFSHYKYDYMTCPRYRVKSKNFERQYNNDNISNKNNIFIKFEKYDLIGNKHIPKEFLENSRENRLNLFAGIIDSDGTVSNKSYCISISKKQLKFKNDLIFLCRSLGYFVNCSEKNVKLNGKIYENWFLTISGNFNDVPVTYNRKIIIPSKNRDLTKYLTFDVESIGEGDYYGFEIDGDKMFLLEDFTVVHNTELIKGLAYEGKRVLLVLPYISVITNKIENDDTITKLFDTFYGSADIKNIEYGRNAVTTFDKFSRSNYEKISKMFDYIILDESHLLFTSSYRIEATSNVIKKIKELFYISSNDPFASKIVLMTGTETGESYFFNSVANITRVTKPHLFKDMEFLICDDTLDSITRLASRGATLISEGYRLMIPTNKGEIYTEKIIGMIEYLLQRPIKYGYYKRSNIEQELCRMINEDNTIGDYEIVFCSNYLSVGVDINDKDLKFASIYLGNFSGYEIEQFNARIRKTGIKSIYCITTNKVDGTTNDVLLSEPDLLLKITEDDQLFFIDDKSIASAKTEFIAQYDPVLHRITTPGFSLLNGKIQFNLEEYELTSFETKYAICMEHPLKVARELSKFGYNIKVSTEFEGLSLSEQETLKKMGIEAAKNEKVRKHNLLVGTFVDMINQNNYANEHGLEYTETIEWILKNPDLIIEDRELTKEVTLNGITEITPCYVQVIFDVFATPQNVIVKSREALEKMIKPAKYLINRYSKKKALDIIYQYVDDNGILKQKNFLRAINLLKIIDSSDANELGEPITKALEKMYLFVDKFEINKDYKIGYETYQSLLDTWTNEYIDILGIKINTKYGFDKIRDGLIEMLQDLSTKSTSKNGIRFSYNKLPEQDSTNVINRRSIDTLVSTMFNITDNLVSNKRRLKEKHIVLKQQQF